MDVSEHLGLVYEVVTKLGHRDDDEFISVGMVALVKAGLKFNPKLGKKFTTYAGRAIRNEVYNWRLHRMAQKSGATKYGIKQALVLLKYRKEFGLFPDLELTRIMLGRKLGKKAYQDLCGVALLIDEGNYDKLDSRIGVA